MIHLQGAIQMALSSSCSAYFYTTMHLLFPSLYFTAFPAFDIDDPLIVGYKSMEVEPPEVKHT